MNKYKILQLITFLSIIVSFFSCSKKEFVKNSGNIFGTTYHFTYQSKNGDLEKNILLEIDKFSKALNNYDSTSLISRINSNETNIVKDHFFIECFNQSQRISDITNGCFDITVAPIVNAWGFGFKHSEKINVNLIDSLMEFVGYKKVNILKGKIIKQNPNITLDVSAIAKGYGVDVASEYLEQKGIENYMVEIGGEVRAMGKNPKGKYWRIGIDRPIDNPNPIYNRELQTIVNLKDKSLATSGNYRQFYKKDGVKYAHTINPKTGYPANSNLLSATVLATNCLTADAFATAFMVMGVEKSKDLVEKIQGLGIYLIYEDSTKTLQTYYSKGFQECLNQ